MFLGGGDDGVRDQIGTYRHGFDLHSLGLCSLFDAINDGLATKKDYTYGRYGRDAKRTENELGIHAIRGGTIPGEHSVIFAGNDEIIEVNHIALSKKVFAEGAVKAAQFLVGQAPGRYDMAMVVND